MSCAFPDRVVPGGGVRDDRPFLVPDPEKERVSRVKQSRFRIRDENEDVIRRHGRVLPASV
jgi:hypothetical protein